MQNSFAKVGAAQRKKWNQHCATTVETRADDDVYSYLQGAPVLFPMSTFWNQSRGAGPPSSSSCVCTLYRCLHVTLNAWTCVISWLLNQRNWHDTAPDAKVGRSTSVSLSTYTVLRVLVQRQDLWNLNRTCSKCYFAFSVSIHCKRKEKKPNCVDCKEEESDYTWCHLAEILGFLKAFFLQMAAQYFTMVFGTT